MFGCERVDWKSFTEGLFQALVIFSKVLRRSPVERQSRVPALLVRDHEHDVKRLTFQASLDFIKAGCTLFTKFHKIQKQDCEKKKFF